MENKLQNRRDYSLDRDFDDGFSDIFDSFFGFPSLPRKGNRYGVLKTDISEYDDKYELSVEVPGLNKKDININLNNGYLTLSANSKKEDKETDKKGNIIRQERFVGSYSRSYFVGKDVKRSDISANMNDGILTIEIKKPVEEVQQDQSIEIK